MMNPDFDPLALLAFLQEQDLAHAENMVKISEFMLSLGTQSDVQKKQTDNLFNMIMSLNKLIKIQEERIIALECQLAQSINNVSLTEQ